MSDYDPQTQIVIDSKIYNREDFSQEQVQAISMINHADQQLATNAQNLRVLQLGRDTMVRALLEDIKDLEIQGEYAEPQEDASEVESVAAK